jgi:AcrR family transcriptional regulator
VSKSVSNIRELPRKPTQRRGIERFDTILNASLAYLESHPIDTLNHYVLADIVGCASSTVYHLFPSNTAIFVALIDRFEAEWTEIVRQPQNSADLPDWHSLLHLKYEAIRDDVNVSEAKLQVLYGTNAQDVRRRSDDSDVRLLAELRRQLETHFVLPDIDRLDERLLFANGLIAAVWHASYLQFGRITKAMAGEASLASTSYLDNYLPRHLAAR